MGTGPSQHSDDDRIYHDTSSSHRHFKNIRPPKGLPHSKNKPRSNSKKTVRSTASVKRTQSMKPKKYVAQKRGSSKKEEKEKGDSGRGSGSASGTGSVSDLELKYSSERTSRHESSSTSGSKSRDRIPKKSRSRKPIHVPCSSNHCKVDCSSSSENESLESCTLCQSHNSDSYNYPLPVCGGKRSAHSTKSHPGPSRAYADLASIKSSEKREDPTKAVTSKTTSNNILHSKGFPERELHNLPISYDSSKPVIEAGKSSSPNSSQKDKHLSVKFELQAKRADAKKTKSLDALHSQRESVGQPEVTTTSNSSVKFSITESKPDYQPSKLFAHRPAALQSTNSSPPLRTSPQSAVSKLTQELKEATSMLRRQSGEVSYSMENKSLQIKASASTASSSGASASNTAFENIVSGTLKNFLDHSNKIGDEVARIGAMVGGAFGAQKGFLDIASKAKKPSDLELEKLLKPTSDKIKEIQSFRESQRRSQYFNHISAISESILALGWVSVSPAPSPYVKEMCDAGQFYTNRVLKDWKDKSRTHVEWCKTWLSTLTELHAFVKEHHTTGLTWNNRGVEASRVSAGGAAAPPPPPPPPPTGLLDDFHITERSGANALFAEINRGEEVTKGLKKVTSDMQTHKNPNIRSQAAPITKSGPSSTSSIGVSRPSKFELDGKKWIIENQKNQSGLVVDKTDMNQSVYIYRCEGSTVKVKGKVNNIILDSCKKTAVVFQDVVSSCEFINCQSVQMQVLGKVPTISVEKTDGCQMYLSTDSLGVVIVSAKSSEMNVLIPSDGDFIEQPIPEQFKTMLSGKKLVTTFAESI